MAIVLGISSSGKTFWKEKLMRATVHDGQISRGTLIPYTLIFFSLFFQDFLVVVTSFFKIYCSSKFKLIEIPTCDYLSKGISRLFVFFFQYFLRFFSYISLRKSKFFKKFVFLKLPIG